MDKEDDSAKYNSHPPDTLNVGSTEVYSSSDDSDEMDDEYFMDRIQFPPVDEADIAKRMSEWGKYNPERFEKMRQERLEREALKKYPNFKGAPKLIKFFAMGDSKYGPNQDPHEGTSSQHLLLLKDQMFDKHVEYMKDLENERFQEERLKQLKSVDDDCLIVDIPEIPTNINKAKRILENDCEPQSSNVSGSENMKKFREVKFKKLKPMEDDCMIVDISETPSNLKNVQGGLESDGKLQSSRVCGFAQEIKHTLKQEIFHRPSKISVSRPSEIIDLTEYEMPNQLTLPKREITFGGTINLTDYADSGVSDMNTYSDWHSNVSDNRNTTSYMRNPINVDSHMITTSAFALNSMNENIVDKNINTKSWEDIEIAANQVRSAYKKNESYKFMADRERVLIRMRQLLTSSAQMPNLTSEIKQPSGLLVELKEFQKFGLAWMVWRESQDPRGGILADDMGLGKTVMLLTLILKRKYDTDNIIRNDKNAVNATLIICPPNLIVQWQQEIETKFSIPIKVFLHHGSEKLNSLKDMNQYDIILTSYAIYAAEYNANTVFATTTFLRVILDEAHVIRNESSQRSKACMNIKAKFKWIVSGTPIHNRVEDLYPVFTFLGFTPFDDKMIWNKWIKGSNGINRLNVIMRYVLLRRTKHDLSCAGILELPLKTFRNEVITFNPKELHIYQRLLVFSKSIFIAFANEHFKKAGSTTILRSNDTTVDSMIKIIKEKNSQLISAQQVLTLIIRLRQFCCHPCLISTMLCNGEVDMLRESTDMIFNESATNQSNDLISLMNDALEVDDEGPDGFNHKNPIFSTKWESSKLKYLLTLIIPILCDTNDKIIIVSEWVLFLNIVAVHLKELGYDCIFYTGDVSLKDRHMVQTDFNTDSNSPRIMLLSLTCGGVGLNLTGANHMFIVSTSWNPMWEVQVQDRIYRMGQNKPVFITRIIIEKSIEERVANLQLIKIATADKIMDEKVTNNCFTMEHLQEIFGIN